MGTDSEIILTDATFKIEMKTGFQVIHQQRQNPERAAKIPTVTPVWEARIRLARGMRRLHRQGRRWTRGDLQRLITAICSVVARRLDAKQHAARRWGAA